MRYLLQLFSLSFFLLIFCSFYFPSYFPTLPVPPPSLAHHPQALAVFPPPSSALPQPEARRGGLGTPRRTKTSPCHAARVLASVRQARGLSASSDCWGNLPPRFPRNRNRSSAAIFIALTQLHDSTCEARLARRSHSSSQLLSLFPII